MRVFIALAAILTGLASLAGAGDEVAAAQNVIRSQAEAFLATTMQPRPVPMPPRGQEIFPQAEIFMMMVQQGYAPVYRQRRFEFGEARAENGVIAQRVQIIGADGEAWEALYTLWQEPDGSLKITGCSLLKAGQGV